MKQEFDKSINFFSEELKKIQIGHVDTSIIAEIPVNAYPGTTSKLRDLGSVAMLDGGMIKISLWDQSISNSVIKGISDYDSTYTVLPVDEYISITFPPVTGESRQNAIKKAKEKLEEARISVRNIRQNLITAKKKEFDNDLISEDVFKNYKSDIDKVVKEINSDIQKLFQDKEITLLK